VAAAVLGLTIGFALVAFAMWPGSDAPSSVADAETLRVTAPPAAARGEAGQPDGEVLSATKSSAQPVREEPRPAAAAPTVEAVTPPALPDAGPGTSTDPDVAPGPRDSKPAPVRAQKDAYPRPDVRY
jgi:hypothetical protein